MEVVGGEVAARKGMEMRREKRAGFVDRRSVDPLSVMGMVLHCRDVAAKSIHVPM
jgi:hypothetical protein